MTASLLPASRPGLCLLLRASAFGLVAVYSALLGAQCAIAAPAAALLGKDWADEYVSSSSSKFLRDWRGHDGAKGSLEVTAAVDLAKNAAGGLTTAEGVATETTLTSNAAAIGHDTYQVHQQPRSLVASGTCLDDISTAVPTSCGSQDVKFIRIVDAVVLDPQASLNTETGIWENACRGYDDYVRVTFLADWVASADRFDVGMYISTDGGDAKNGECLLAPLTEGTFTDPSGGLGKVVITEAEIGANADGCLDVIGTNGGTIMYSYPFEDLLMKCDDSDGDGLLDFRIVIGWSNGDGTRYCDSSSTDPLDWPAVSQKPKCWAGDADTSNSFTLDILVPNHLSPTDVPSFEPSVSPSSQPSKSSQPSSEPSLTPSHPPSKIPSQSPSESFMPSEYPSLKPSQSPSDFPSLDPSDEPSLKPSQSPSDVPSLTPSQSPSDVPSDLPSLEPSLKPSDEPSLLPSQSPSVSQEPSSLPSSSPSVSLMPSISAAPSTSTEFPSDSPSLSSKPSSEPTLLPSASPSVSQEPTSNPSASPTVSSMPSISTSPTSTTPWPSSIPSISAEPTPAPSSEPSKSSMPSASPSAEPSAQPSAQPTDGFYYPDWTNEDQVCTNDGNDPEYMLEIQRVNYLYRSKEDCCRNHFWWRITQCMANEHPMYYSTGSACDVKVEFEDWESKYTPGSWDASGLYDTMEECCIAEFWFDIDGCLGDSPRDTTFEFSFDIAQLHEPTNCQDADIFANAIGVGIDNVLGGTSTAEVQSVGCATISRNYDTGNPECGGCISGTFIGDYDGRAVNLGDATGIVTTISGIITTTSTTCSDAACFEELINSAIDKFSTSVTDGSLTDAIIAWAYERLPPVKQLWDTWVVTTSFDSSTGTNPFTITADSTSGLEVTVGGSFDINFDFTQVTTVADLKLLATYFTNAITSTLDDEGNLPSGASIELTTICGVDLATATDPVECSSTSSAIEYTSTMYLAHDADAEAITTSVSDALSNPTTIQGVTSAVIAEASAGVSVPLIQVTTSGSLSVTNFDTTSFTADETAEAFTFFEDAILETLVSQGLVSPGSSVVVTSISSGSIQYNLITHVDASVDTTSATSEIQTALSSSSTMTAISTSVITAASTSSSTTLSTATESLAVSSSAVGTPIESDVFKVTTSGEFSVPSLDLSTLTTSAEIIEASKYFEDAITEQLESAGLLPAGSTVTITGIVDGVVEYEIALYASTTSASETTVSRIGNLFSGSASSTVLRAISSSVVSAASTSSSSAISSTLSNVSIDLFTAGATTGIPSTSGAVASSLVSALQSLSIKSFTPEEAAIRSLAKYYPDWVNKKTCVNDGREPPFIKEIGDGYMFDTAKQCCSIWFSYDEACGQSASALSALKYYPLFDAGECGVAPYNELESKSYVYDSLTECCLKRFPLALDTCCDAEGLGGCVTTGVTKYVPNFIEQKCQAKSEDFIDPSESKYARDTMLACCESNFSWDTQSCCTNSGGC